VIFRVRYSKELDFGRNEMKWKEVRTMKGVSGEEKCNATSTLTYDPCVIVGVDFLGEGTLIPEVPSSFHSSLGDSLHGGVSSPILLRDHING